MQKITHLIPLSEFVTNAKKSYLKGELEISDFYNQVTSYTEFLQQPLEIWQFVPIGNNGEVLEEPKESDFKDETGFVNNAYFMELNDYNKAKERCLFGGIKSMDNFKIHKGEKYEYWLLKFPYSNYSNTHTPEQYENNLIGTHVCTDFKIEALCPFNLPLTPSALKQIY